LSSFIDFDFKGSSETFLSKLRVRQCASYEVSPNNEILLLELCIEKEGVDVDALFSNLTDLMKLYWPIPLLILDKGNIFVAV
jgi:hypothetical protein